MVAGAAGPAVRALGLTAYEPTWQAMRAFTDARTPASADEIWLTEHPPVYTLGLAGRRTHLLRDNGIAVIAVDRGGQVTYHGPGQLVAYLLFDLKRTRRGVRDKKLRHKMVCETALERLASWLQDNSRTGANTGRLYEPSIRS